MSVLVTDFATAGLLVGEQVTESQPYSEDAGLIARAREGDQSAFRLIVEKYRGIAYYTAYGFLRDEHLARDISQEAFVRVHRSLHRYDPARSFSTWLRRITVNLSIDELRRKRRRAEVPLEDGFASPNDRDPVRKAELAEEQRAVWETLDKLPLKYRTVMVLREIQGLTTNEVAKIVGRPEVSVRWRLHRARKLFRRQWLARFGEA